MHVDPKLWTNALVRELLTAVYGGYHHRNGTWVPDIAHVARRRKVAQSTVRRWTKHGSTLSIPVPRLDAIVRAHRPKTSTLQRERLQAQRTDLSLQRGRLGRRRGNLAEYRGRGWLDQHRVLVLEEPDTPLRRVVVVRDEPSLIRRVVRESRIVDITIADSKFAGDQIRYWLLDMVRPWRLELPKRKHPRGHTQVWLAGAPMPDLPLQTNPTARRSPPGTTGS